MELCFCFNSRTFKIKPFSPPVPQKSLPCFHTFSVMADRKCQVHILPQSTEAFIYWPSNTTHGDEKTAAFSQGLPLLHCHLFSSLWKVLCPVFSLSLILNFTDLSLGEEIFKIHLALWWTFLFSLERMALTSDSAFFSLFYEIEMLSLHQEGHIFTCLKAKLLAYPSVEAHLLWIFKEFFRITGLWYRFNFLGESYDLQGNFGRTSKRVSVT